MAQRITPLVGVKETPDPAEREWLTAKAVMEKTGISQSDLIRFIQLKVLPKSMMRVSPTGRDGTRKISSFSASVLGHVAMLKLLRDEGHTVETIASELGPAEETPPFSHERPLPESQPTVPSAGKEPDNSASLYFHLPADTIKGSAFFVNQDMHIGWINVHRDDRLFSAIQDELQGDPAGTVFDIILRASLKELVFDWQPLFAFIYRFLRDTTAPVTFNRLAPKVLMNLQAIDRLEPSDTAQQKTRPSVDSCPVRIEKGEGLPQAMQFHAIALSEGTLFIFEKARRRNSHGGDEAGESDSKRRMAAESADRKTPFSVISARLDDSRRMVDTLLPEAYFQLMTRIWDESDRIIQSYGGQRAKRSGTDVQYIIPRHADTDPAFDAICCAVALREKMHEIEASLKADGGWYADIRLNIGISSGRDHLPAEDPTASVAFMLPGGAADQAFHLSAIAHGGGIFITKSAFGHLDLEQMERITFGIYRDDRLVPKIFAQVAELPHGPDTRPLGREIESLFVTRIIDLQSDQTN